MCKCCGVRVAFIYMCAQSQGGFLATLDCRGPEKLFSVCQVKRALLTNAAAILILLKYLFSQMRVCPYLYKAQIGSEG